MRQLFLFIFLSLLTSAVSFAQLINDASDNALVFEIVQSEYLINLADVKVASVIMDKGIYKGLHIQLKDAAAAEFENMTNAGIGKKVNFIFNKKIVSAALLQTSLKGNFLITGISKEEATAFVTMLSNEAKRKK